MTYVNYKYKLPESVRQEILSLTPKFGFDAFSEILFYRTYSRTKPDGTMESWNDVVIRCIEGCLTLRKDHYLKCKLLWDEDFWNHYSRNFALAMFRMDWLPAGRGLWGMGTDFLYERGSMCLFNCAVTKIDKDIGSDINWMMDALMCGVGVGFLPERDETLTAYRPDVNNIKTYVIPDTREGWCESVKLLIDSFLKPNSPTIVMDYSQVRPSGLLIKGFGGISSGPEPLEKLHNNIRFYFEQYLTTSWYNTVLLKTDIANAVGCAVVAGNVRRSAEIACGNLYDETFLNLKNYGMFPYRQSIGWMSNNSVFLESNEDYDKLQEIAERIKDNGEPGIINLKNLKYGRIGHPEDNLKVDNAIGFNPCGEIPLENKELCNLVETFPTNCETVERWYKACEYATVYASSVALLPTHRPETNAVMMRNRRIGVSIADFTGWVHTEGRNKVIKYLRKGYGIVRKTNRWVNGEAGVPESIRTTTVKPGGTIPKLVGKTSGCGYPNFHETLRRFRIAANSPMVPLLIEANIPYEKDIYSDNTLVFEFPIPQGPAKPAMEASIWEQAENIKLLQREWADNAVSNTINFKPKWIKDKEFVINSLSDADVFDLNKKFNISLHDLLTFHNEKYETPNFKYVWDTTLGLFSIYRFNPEHEEDVVLDVLASLAPHIKSVSLLPQTYAGVYKQMPEEGISKLEFKTRRSQIGDIDWTKLRFHNAETEVYCTGDSCERKV